MPAVGKLFGSTTDNQQKRERMFLITPKIVSDKLAQAAAIAAPLFTQLGSPLVPLAPTLAAQAPLSSLMGTDAEAGPALRAERGLSGASRRSAAP